jgi:acyl carrier protein
MERDMESTSEMAVPAAAPRAPADGEVWSGVRAILAELSNRPASALTLEARIESDLAFDSLLLIELSVRLEERFDIVVPPSASPADLSIKTAADVVRLVEELRTARRSETEPERGRNGT